MPKEKNHSNTLHLPTADPMTGVYHPWSKFNEHGWSILNARGHSYERIGGEGVLCRVRAQHALDEVLSRLRRLSFGRQIDFVLALQEGASALRSEGLKFGSVFGMMCVG